MDNQKNLPEVADVIEVLWKLEDGSEYWWQAAVLEITPRRSKGFVGTGLLQYKPGPTVDYLSDYTVTFFNNGYIYHHQDGKKNHPFRQNSWRFLSVTSSATNTGSISELSEHPNANDVHDSDKERKNSPELSLEKYPSEDSADSVIRELTLRVQGLENSVLSIQDKLKQFQSSAATNEKLSDSILSLDRLSVIANFKSHLRRTMIHILGSSARTSIRNNKKIFRNHSSKDIVISIPCSITIFKWISSDLNTTFNGNLVYIPSRHSIYYSCRSVPSYHVVLGTFKNVCDWLDIRDIHDRSSLCIRTDKQKDLSNDTLRIVGTVHVPENSGVCSYHIGSDVSNLKYALDIQLTFCKMCLSTFCSSKEDYEMGRTEFRLY